ncbi:MAG: hypothetical protein CV087_21665 [Candidatus Brocadia sp. WS118]|nr:MAG: hypothetical protein CV087_21665 [Candidatus Brocadia sp. WS118]
MSVVVKLQEEEMDVLMQYPADSEVADAALRELLEKLRSQIDGEKAELSLSEEDLASIQAFASGNGNGSIDESLLQLFDRLSGQNVES